MPKQDLFLETHGVKLGFMSAFVKAAADALLKVGDCCLRLLHASCSLRLQELARQVGPRLPSSSESRAVFAGQEQADLRVRTT